MTDEKEIEYHRLLEFAVRAGRVMLSSGAETYRVEDTMNRILATGSLETADTFVMATGVIATISDPAIRTLTMVRRVQERNTNLNKVTQVNEVSRMFCSGKMDLEQANRRMDQIEAEVLYSSGMFFLGVIGTTAFFAPIFGGNIEDLVISGLVGLILASILFLCRKNHIHSFLENLISSAAVALMAVLLAEVVPWNLNRDVIIVSCIMPMVPGVAITNAIRDTFHGDYTSGMARILEAVMTAVAIAVGAGIGVAAGQLW